MIKSEGQGHGSKFKVTGAKQTRVLHEITVVHGIEEGKIVWSGSEIIVVVALGTEKLMQHVLLEIHEVTEQCDVVVLDELNCRCPISRV